MADLVTRIPTPWPLSLSTLKASSSVRSSPMYTGRPTRAEIETTHLAHNRIYHAVVAGDADEAATAMREHITASWARRRPRTASESVSVVTP